MKSKTILINLIIVTLFACNNSENKKVELRNIETLTQIVTNNDFSQKVIVLIIPFDGCSSCFTESTKLIPEVLSYSGIVIIPNRHKKRIYNFINEIGADKNDIVIDTLQLSITNRIIDGNPKIFLIDHKKVLYSKTVDINSIEEIRSTIFR